MIHAQAIRMLGIIDKIPPAYMIFSSNRIVNMPASFE